MRLATITLSALCLGVFLGAAFQDAAGVAQAEKQLSRYWYDVNDDSQTNISDPIFLLEWLFNGGPPPMHRGVPATGQTTCFDGAGATIPCSAPDWIGQDAQYQCSCAMTNRFQVTVTNDTVIDRCTGLEWQRNPSNMALTWQQALAFCENSGVANHTDWRLPNLHELESIKHYGKDVAYDDAVFNGPNRQTATWFWSSTTVGIPGQGGRGRANDEAYVVLFGAPLIFSSNCWHGPTSWSRKTSARLVRAVRTAEL